MGMQQDVIVDADRWRDLLRIRREQPTRINIGVLNAVPHMSPRNKGFHRWLLRDDVLRVLAEEAARLDSRELWVLRDRIAETTAPKEG